MQFREIFTGGAEVAKYTINNGMLHVLDAILYSRSRKWKKERMIALKKIKIKFKINKITLK